MSAGLAAAAAAALAVTVAVQPDAAADQVAALAGSVSGQKSTAAGGNAITRAAAVTDTLRVDGNRLLDTCGDVFVVRGSETFLGLGIDVDGSRLRVVEGMVATGVNAVRLIPNINTLSLSEIDSFLNAAAEAKVVVFLTPNGGNGWFARQDVKNMLDKYKKWLIIDAYGEAPYDDRDRWERDVKDGIAEIRSYGYTVPVVVLANRYGRDLPSLFERGEEIVSSDPLRNTVLGWQAYWGTKNNYYQDLYGYSLTEGIAAAADQDFPVQIGIDHFADLPDNEMDYPAAMTAAQEHGVGWLWWDWYNPFGRTDNLTEDGTEDSLTEVGEEVIDDHPAGIRNTARKACGE